MDVQNGGTIKIAFCAATFCVKLCKLFRPVLLTNFFFARFLGPMVLVRSRSVAYLSIEQVRRAFGQGAWTRQMPCHHWSQARLAAWELDRHWTGSALFWQLGPLNTKKRAKERK